MKVYSKPPVLNTGRRFPTNMQSAHALLLKAKRGEKGTARGEPYSNRYAFGFRFQGGRICEVWELMDSVRFQKQMGAR